MVRGLSSSKQLSKGASSQTVILLSGLLLVCLVTLAGYAFMAVEPATPVAPVPSVSIASELIDVLVPIEKIELGSALEPSMFRKESRLATSRAPSVLKSFDDIRGGYAASYMPAGQPIVSEYVTLKQPVNQIQANIPDGYRAVALAVDNTTSVEGWARPGAKVDVMLAAAVNGKAALSVIIQTQRCSPLAETLALKPPEKRPSRPRQ